VRRNSGAPVSRRPGGPAVAAAFDALRFGREQTLDLRSSLPTGVEAARRAEIFLRERQVTGAREVLVITGRGNQSLDGVPVVRPAVAALLAKLRRRGVVADWKEHTPGSFVVVPASIRTLLEAPRRHRTPVAPTPLDPAEFAGLAASTRRVLRRLAIRSLAALGAPDGESFVQDEMQRQFSILAASVSAGPHREARLRAAAERALDEMDDAE
jgi:hypothetical protein